MKGDLVCAVPGILFGFGIFYNVELLGRHSARIREENLPDADILTYNGYDHDSSKTTASEEDIPDLNVFSTYGVGFILHGKHAGIDKLKVPVIFKASVGIVISGSSLFGYFHPDTAAVLVNCVTKKEAIHKIKLDLLRFKRYLFGRLLSVFCGKGFILCFHCLRLGFV